MNPSEIAIRVEDVHKSFGSRKILNGVNFEVRAGETLVIMGGSGGGKSTLLKILIGLLEPDHGRVSLCGQQITLVSEDEKNEVRKKFGMLFQSAALFNSKTIAENVALPLLEHTDLDPDLVRIVVKMKLELVGLSGLDHLKPYQISGGMKKRVALARAIALDPQIVFYDEPGAGLDPITASVVDRLIMDLTKKLRITSVVVTHEIKSAFRIADRMILLQQGEVAAFGTPDEFRNSENPYLKQFLEGEVHDTSTLGQDQDRYFYEILGEEF